MSSAICFNLDQSKILSSGDWLTQSCRIKIVSDHTEFNLLTAQDGVLFTIVNDRTADSAGQD